MTPKQKAEELVEKMWVYALPNENGSCQKNAKQCALIAVDNIILANPHSNPFNTDVYSTFTYWSEVEQEIKKL
jgi:hypothetical protein